MGKTKNFSVKGMSFYELTQAGPDGSAQPYFCIPPYQRQYTWEPPQVMQLLGDVYDYFLESCEAETGSFAEKFIGAFIIVEKESSAKQLKTVYDVIDGQQRLTTLSLIVAAAVKVLLEIAVKIADLAEHSSTSDPELKENAEELNRKIKDKVVDTIKMLYDASYTDLYAPKLFRENDDIPVRDDADSEEDSKVFLPKECKIRKTSDAEVEACYKSPTARFFFYLTKVNAFLCNWNPTLSDFANALSTICAGEKYLVSLDNKNKKNKKNKRDQQQCYKSNYELAYAFLLELSLGMRNDGDIESLRFNENLNDESQYDPRPMPESVKDSISVGSSLLRILKDLRAIFSSKGLPDNSKLKDLATEALYVISYLEFLSERVSIAVISGNNETALDLFETMNTAGQPLGSIETFIPEVYQTVAKLEKNIPGIKKNDLLEKESAFGVIQDSSIKDILGDIQTILGVGKNRAGVSQVVIWFSLICFGRKVGKNFSIQRSEMKKNFRAFVDSNDRSFAEDADKSWREIYEFVSLLLFVGKWWVYCYGELSNLEAIQDVPVANRFESNWAFDNGFLPEDLQDQIEQSEIDVFNFCLLFLIRAGQSLSVAIIGRYYVQLLSDPNVFNLRQLVKAAKAVAAFTAVWLSGEKGSTQYAETQRRTMAHEVDVKKVKQAPGKLAYFRKTSRSSGERVTAEQLQKSFINGYEVQNKSFALKTWIDKLPGSELASQRKEVNRFLLLLYWHSSSSKKCYQSFGIRDYADKPNINFLTGKMWNILSKLEIEHIVPQEPNGWKLDFDPNSTEGKRFLNEIGNTTLLPKKLNVYASNNLWEYKQRLYDIVCASNSYERKEIFNSLGKIPESDRKTISKQLEQLDKEIREVDTVLVDSVRNITAWNSSVVQTRTEAIARIVWPLLSEWLGRPEKFDKNAFEALLAGEVAPSASASADKAERETKPKEVAEATAQSNVESDDVQEKLRPFFGVIPRASWTKIEREKLTIDNASSYLSVRIEEGKTIVEMGRRGQGKRLRSEKTLPASVSLEKISGADRMCEGDVFVYTGTGPEAEETLVGLVKKRRNRFVENQP